MDIPEKIRHLHDEAAKRVTADGPWLLVCRSCAKHEDSSADALSGYLRNGWPKCCAETMELRRA